MNSEKLNRASLSGLNVNDETRGMLKLKEDNVKRKSPSKRRSKSCDVVDKMSTKRSKRFSKNDNRISVGGENATEVVLEVTNMSQFAISESEENEVKRAVEAVVFGYENEDEVA